MRNLTGKKKFLRIVVAICICLYLIIGLAFTYRNNSSSTPCAISKIIENKSSSSLIFREPHMNSLGYLQLLKYLKTFFNGQPYSGAKTYIAYTLFRLGLHQINNIKPLQNEYGDVINDVTAFKYLIDIQKCKKKSTSYRTMFISILSAPNYFQKRQTIRETWLRHFKDSVYHMNLIDVIGYGFVLGKFSNDSVQIDIQKESRTHGDILQVEMDDNYYNLTRKSVAILNWVNIKCSHADFILKIDDDTFINVRKMAETLVQLSPKKPSIYGKKVGDHENMSRTSCKYIVALIQLLLFITPFRRA